MTDRAATARPRRGAWTVLVLMTAAQAGATLNQQGLGGLAPLFASAFRLDHAALGLAYGAIYLGSTLGTAPSGILVDRSGERRVVLWAGLGMGAALVVAASLPSFPWLVAWLFLFGVGYAPSSPAGGRAILAWFAPRERGFAMGIRQAGAPVGGALGALLLPFIGARAGYAAALVAGAVICALSAVAAAAWYREPPSDTADCAVASPTPSGSAASGPAARDAALRSLIGAMLRFAAQPRSVLVSATGFVLAAGQYTVVAFIVVALARNGIALAVAGSSLAIMQGVGMVARPTWGLVSDRLWRGDRFAPLATLCALAAAALWTLGSLPTAVHRSALPELLLSIALGASVIGFTGLFTTLLAEMGGATAAGSAMGVGLTFNYAAGFVVPPIFGAVVDAAGFALAWRALAGFVACGIVFALAARGTTITGEGRRCLR